jgi:cytochrome c oxidase cbb3-type subunit I/II
MQLRISRIGLLTFTLEHWLGMVYGFWYDLLVGSKNDKRTLFSAKLSTILDWNIRLYTLPCMLQVLQASMWKQFNPDGTLTYGNFLKQ